MLGRWGEKGPVSVAPRRLHRLSRGGVRGRGGRSARPEARGPVRVKAPHVPSLCAISTVRFPAVTSPRVSQVVGEVAARYLDADAVPFAEYHSRATRPQPPELLSAEEFTRFRSQHAMQPKISW
jgi:hypothetical protein